MNEIVTAIVDETFDVRRHLARMRVWQDEWSSEDEQLRARLRPLKTNKPLDKQGLRQSLAVLIKIETVVALCEHKSRLPVSVLISKNEECLTP